jgi:hypothetical protein
MPSFVSQDQISSVTDRTRTRTAYLTSLRSGIEHALTMRYQQDPNATDYTLAALSAIGRSSLRQVARNSGRDFDTVKQDVGLFVPQILVDQFGPTRVHTYRSDDGAAASQRSAGWPDLEGWVNRYCPHRIVSPSERIILDTAVVREDALDLNALGRVAGNHPVSLADGAVIELVHWMRSSGKRSAFPVWPDRARRYAEVLDPTMPIAPGGHELAALAGLRDFEPGFSAENLREYSREVWKFLAGVKNATDLDKPYIFRLSNQKVTFDVRPTSPVLKRTGDEWAALALRVGELLRSADRSSVTDGELRKLFVQNLAANGEVRHVDRLDLVIAALARRTYEAAFLGASPKPGVSNDALDFSLLFSVALPAVVCTSDQHFVNFVRQLKSRDSNKVMSPDELLVWLATGKLPS